MFIFLPCSKKYLIYARLTNQKYDIGLRFKSVTITEFINKDLEFDYQHYQEAVINNSGIKINTETLKSRVIGESHNNYDFWEICRGHDLVKVMQYVFSSGRECLSYGNSIFDEKELSRFIRGAYEEQWFIHTSMYINLKNWQSRKHVDLLDVG